MRASDWGRSGIAGYQSTYGPTSREYGGTCTAPRSQGGLVGPTPHTALSRAYKCSGRPLRMTIARQPSQASRRSADEPACVVSVGQVSSFFERVKKKIRRVDVRLSVIKGIHVHLCSTYCTRSVSKRESLRANGLLHVCPSSPHPPHRCCMSLTLSFSTFCSLMIAISSTNLSCSACSYADR